MSAELKLQSQCYQWFHNTYPSERKMLFRIKNELDNHPYKTKADIFKQLSENKATGVVDGVADFCFLLFGKTAFIELKVKGNKQSEAQKSFEVMVLMRQHEYYVIEDTLEAFQLLIKTLFKKYGTF